MLSEPLKVSKQRFCNHLIETITKFRVPFRVTVFIASSKYLMSLLGTGYKVCIFRRLSVFLHSIKMINGLATEYFPLVLYVK